MRITEVIKTEMDRGTFVYKYPVEDFNTRSQLIVQQSQEALLFVNGQACDLFEAGRYTLETGNIPILKRLMNLPTGGISPFHCVVYFINKTEQMNLNWGIRDVNFPDATNNDYTFKIGASGELSLCISDARKLIAKLVGTQTALDRETLMNFFKVPIVKIAKEILPKTLREDKISIFEVESTMSKLSEQLKQQISAEMADYGISLEKFWIQNIVKPENDPFYIKLNNQRGQKVVISNQGELDMLQEENRGKLHQMQAENEVKADLIRHSGEVEKSKMNTDAKAYDQAKVGYSYIDKRRFDMLDKMAENQSGGNAMGISRAAIDLGVGFGMAGAANNIVHQTMATSMNGTAPLAQNVDTMVTMGMGQNNGIPPVQGQNSTVPPASAQNTTVSSEPVQSNAPQQQQEVNPVLKAFEQKVQMLMMVRDILSDEEFAAQKQALLNEIRGNHE